jgi:hypothetical protein
VVTVTAIYIILDDENKTAAHWGLTVFLDAEATEDPK